uniref:Uncharacterized protein n=1 Tax=Arundo donax TaxID=35708 RepID=A0A0A8ZFM6_ARUDO
MVHKKCNQEFLNTSVQLVYLNISVLLNLMSWFSLTDWRYHR